MKEKEVEMVEKTAEKVPKAFTWKEREKNITEYAAGKVLEITEEKKKKRRETILRLSTSLSQRSKQLLKEMRRLSTVLTL